MDTSAPAPRRRRGRRADLTMRIVGAFVILCAIVLAVAAYAVSELSLQAARDHEVVQEVLAAQGHGASTSPSLRETRTEHLQLTMVRPPLETRRDTGSVMAEPVAMASVDALAMAEAAQRAQDANRVMWLLMPAGVMIGIALAVALAREVARAARRVLSHG